jgi:hypothetical protein
VHHGWSSPQTSLLTFDAKRPQNSTRNFFNLKKLFFLLIFIAHQKENFLARTFRRRDFESAATVVTGHGRARRRNANIFVVRVISGLVDNFMSIFKVDLRLLVFSHTDFCCDESKKKIHTRELRKFEDIGSVDEVDEAEMVLCVRMELELVVVTSGGRNEKVFVGFFE